MLEQQLYHYEELLRPDYSPYTEKNNEVQLLLY